MKFLSLSASDGHTVKSNPEKKIDDWLTIHKIKHQYGKRITDKKMFRTDWFCEDFSVYIEYWGLTGVPEYDLKRLEKIKVYQENKLKLLNLFPSDNIFEILEKNLTDCIPFTTETLRNYVKAKNCVTYVTIMFLIKLELQNEFTELIEKWINYKKNKTDTFSRYQTTKIQEMLKGVLIEKTYKVQKGEQQ